MTSPKQADELLSCPFCGSSNVELISQTRFGVEWCVVCHGCHIGTGHSPDPQVVKSGWNTRARLSSPSVPEGLMCRFGCEDRPVVLVEFEEGGCICYPDHIQALCSQHWNTAEPLKGARVLIDFAQPPSAPPEAGKVQDDIDNDDRWDNGELGRDERFAARVDDDDDEVLFALQMACEHDIHHQAQALRTWLPRIKKWREALRSPVAQGAGVLMPEEPNGVMLGLIAGNYDDGHKLTDDQARTIYYALRAAAARHPSHLTGSDVAAGTFDCPVCGWPEIHAHADYELVERPYIDGARTAFEKEAREFMLRPYFKGLRTGYNWINEAKNARGIASGSIHLSDWAARQWPQGLYVHTFVEVMWALWCTAWLSARRSQHAAPPKPTAPEGG